jgi:hypothetical protein
VLEDGQDILCIFHEIIKLWSDRFAFLINIFIRTLLYRRSYFLIMVKFLNALDGIQYMHMRVCKCVINMEQYE